MLAAYPGVVEAPWSGRPAPCSASGCMPSWSLASDALAAEALRAFCAERLSDYKVPGERHLSWPTRCRATPTARC